MKNLSKRELELLTWIISDWFDVEDSNYVYDNDLKKEVSIILNKINHCLHIK